MLRIPMQMLVIFILFGLAACAQAPLARTPAPVVSSSPIQEFTPTPTSRPTLTLAASPALSPALPSPTQTRPTTTPRHTATAPARTPTAHPPQTSVVPTVPSEGWDTNTLLALSGKPGRLYALQGDRDARYFSSTRRRLLISDDLGDTWKPFPGGLPVAPTCLANIDLDYATRDALYASTCQGLFRWSGNAWTFVSSQETRQVAIVYGHPKEIWAIVAPQKGAPVLYSDDGGQTWHSASDNLVHIAGLATLGIDPRDSKTIYGIIMPKYGGSYLRRMFVGNSWQILPTPLDNRMIDTGMTIDGATGDLYVTVFTEQGWQLWRTRNPEVSDERAVVWEKVTDFPPGLWANVLASVGTAEGLVLFVRLAPSNCSVYDAKCDPSIERSLDGGKTWERLAIR